MTYFLLATLFRTGVSVPGDVVDFFDIIDATELALIEADLVAVAGLSFDASTTGTSGATLFTRVD